MTRPKPFSFVTSPVKRYPRARLGTLVTPHGTVQTPSYVIVGTHGTVRALTPDDVTKSGTQMIIANTYHLRDAGTNAVRRRLKAKLPTMTDSGGFQVFSLGAAKDQGVGKVLRQPHRRVPHQSTVTFSERGATITVDGKKTLLTPESSMRIQERLGADIAFAFDECTSPLHPLGYTKQSMERTHRWALRCLKAHNKRTQLLYGIVQGGKFKSLRVTSAKAIGAMPFDGFGIGGSFGKAELANTLAWVTPHLPSHKPRHLLGIGTVRDVFSAVEAGIDTMDCVIPTREARHGRIYTDKGAIDVRKNLYATGEHKALHALFRARDPEGGRLATLHNVRFFNDLLQRIRTALGNGSYTKLKRSFLKYY